MNFGREKLYRAKDGKILGVCKGIANWLGWPVAAIRLILIIIALVTAVIPTILLYLLAAVILSPEPEEGSWEDEENFYRNCRYAWRDFRSNVRHEYDNLRYKQRSKE